MSKQKATVTKASWTSLGATRYSCSVDFEFNDPSLALRMNCNDLLEIADRVVNEFMEKSTKSRTVFRVGDVVGVRKDFNHCKYGVTHVDYVDETCDLNHTQPRVPWDQLVLIWRP